MSKRNIDVDWLKHIIKGNKDTHINRIDCCSMSILIRGIHELETLEPCCTHCPSFKDLYNMDKWCSDYVFLNMSLC